jgi:hypothetical protein
MFVSAAGAAKTGAANAIIKLAVSDNIFMSTLR